MNAHEAKAAFERTLHGNGQTLSDLTVDRGVAIMLAFYRDQRASDCSIDSDGDMLLFQFGTHDWGDGESFEFDLTRQFIIDGDDDAGENIFQLSLTFQI